MSDPTPNFPEPVLTEIGRVTVAATKLEFMLAQFACVVHTQESANELLSRPGRVLPAAMQAAEALEPELARAFGNWIEQASQVLGERHRVIHSLWMLRASVPGIAEYFARHPRTALEMDANPDILRSIATRLEECSDYGFELIFANGSQIKPRKSKSEHS